jgi:hypothetical protein
MKKFFMLCSMLATTLCYAQPGNVGIGTTTPNAGAMLDVNSSTRTLLFPRLTSAALGNVTTPVEGMAAYNVDKRSLVGYIGSPGATLISQNQVGTGIIQNAHNLFGQSFTPASTFALYDVGVYLQINAAVTFTMDIYAGAGTNGTKLGTTSIFRNGQASSINGFQNFNFSSLNVVLQSGQTYTFQLTNDAIVNNPAQVFTGSGYAGGAMFVNGVAKEDGVDLAFRIRSQGAGGWQQYVTNAQDNGGAHMIAAAYGNVFSNAVSVINNSSNNCVLTHTPNSGIYEIIFTGGDLASTDISTLAVNALLFGGTPGFITFTGGEGYLVIRTFNTSGALTDRGFGFSVFRP